MRFFLRKNATTAARRNDDETGMGQGGSTPDDGAQMTEMRQNIMRMERQMEEQSKQMQQLMTHQSDQLSAIMKTMEGEKNQERLPIECGSYELSFNGTIWSVVGVSCKEPDPDYDYFPGLAWTCDEIGKKGAGPDKIISAIIPCYNEDGKDLERTIRGLSRQILPGNWRVEVVIVMDGVEAISDTMAEYLFSLFGIHFKPKDDSIVNPFLELPDANTIIVHPCSEKSAMARYPVMEGTTGGFSLVVKKENRRKANSQQWWLGPHASAIKCKYALATDCGAFFERTTVCKLMERLDDEPAVHAVSGTQKTMPANLQGDGDFEFIHKPFHFLLRMLQRFEFEVDNVSFMSVYDTLGALPVIPGPCGLYRFSKLGSLKDPDSLMRQYFRLFSRSNRGLILGNVELVEDRIPGTLLVFPQKKSGKEENVMPPEGWPKTGIAHEAIFYMEAEKPLSQLVKQRRRWLNGTFATSLWMLHDGIITNSNQDPISKLLAWCLLVLGVFQGLVVRMFGPALLIVWTFRFGLFIPDLVADPARIFDPELSLLDVEAEKGRLRDGILFGGFYLLLYVCFVIGHTPRAKPVQDEISFVKFTEPSRYKNDVASAYRDWLFLPALWINFIVVALYVLNAIGIVWALGWNGTPLVVRILIAFCFLPFVAGALDGVSRCNFRALWSMIIAAPFAMPLMLWFTIWLPAYATTRLSDLSWGNRSRKSLDETENALSRAENGEKVARFLIGFNVMVALIVIGLMQFYGWVFPMFVMAYTLVQSCTFAVSFIEIIYRMLSSLGGVSRYSKAEQFHSGKEEDAYEKMEDMPVAEETSTWCCFRRSAGSNGSTGGSTDSDIPSLPDSPSLPDLVDASPHESPGRILV